MLAIVGRSVQVGIGLHALGHQRGGFLDVGWAAGRAFQRFLDVGGPVGLARQPGDADARQGDLAAGFADARRDADDGESGRGLKHFLIAGSGRLVFHRDDHFADHLARFERGGEGIDEEIGDGNFALGLWR